MFGDHVTYRVHAVRRMFERGISEVEVRRVLSEGQVIESRPDDLPYPGRLPLGFVDGLPLHMVAAYDVHDDTTFVVTVYQPDLSRWSADFRRRRMR